MSLDECPDCRVAPECVGPESVPPSLLDAARCIALVRECGGASPLYIAEPCPSSVVPNRLLPWDVSGSIGWMSVAGALRLERGLLIKLDPHWSPVLCGCRWKYWLFGGRENWAPSAAGRGLIGRESSYTRSVLDSPTASSSSSSTCGGTWLRSTRTASKHLKHLGGTLGERAHRQTA